MCIITADSRFGVLYVTVIVKLTGDMRNNFVRKGSRDIRLFLFNRGGSLEERMIYYQIILEYG